MIWEMSKVEGPIGEGMETTSTTMMRWKQQVTLLIGIQQQRQVENELISRVNNNKSNMRQILSKIMISHSLKITINSIVHSNKILSQTQQIRLQWISD